MQVVCCTEHLHNNCEACLQAPCFPHARLEARRPQEKFPWSISAARSCAHPFPNMLNNLNLEDVPYNKEERIPDSIAQELDFWEKAVFSFDMDRNSSAGGSSSSSGANDPGAHRGEAERRRQDGTRHPNSSTAASGTGETSLGVHQTPTLHELLNMHTQQSTAQGMAPLTQVPQQPGQPGMLDPYTLAHLAALSALTSPGVSSQQQQPAGGNGSQADPFAVLRQVQSLLYPYGPPGHGAGHSLPLTGMSQNYQPMHPHGVQQGPPGSALPAQIPNRPGNTTTSGQPWPAYPNANQMYPPIDPALFEQYPHLLSLMPTTGQAQQAQTPGAGPSSISGNRRSPSVPTANAASPQSPANQTQDETVVSEDKRRRNTAASGIHTQPTILDFL